VPVRRDGNRDVQPAAATSPASPPSTPPAAAETHPAAETHQGFLYGRITTVDGATYEGRLRWGKKGDQEAFWGDYFNGFKPENPWLAHVPPERLKERRPIEILGITIAHRGAIEACRLEAREPAGARFGGGGDAV
jgi:hypothetical protein